MEEILTPRENMIFKEKQRIFKIIFPILTLFCFSQSVVNVIFTKNYDVTVIISFIEDCSVCLAYLWAFFTAYRNTQLILATLIPVALSCLLLRMYLEGGVTVSSATLWLFIFPLISAYFTNKTYTYTISGIMSIAAISIFYMKNYGLEGFAGSPTYLLGVVANIWIITFLLCNYEKNRVKSQEIIDRQHKDRLVINSHYSTSQVIQGFAHEVNNPLCIINLVLQQLELENKIDEVDKEKIEKNVMRIKDLINGLKERINKHVPDLSHRQKTFGQVLESVLSFHSEEFDSNRIRVRSNMNLINKIPMKFVDSEVFEALNHIIKNSIENVLQQEDRELVISYYPDVNQIHINDSGPDFSEEARDLATTTFYTTKHNHSGIGLSTAKELLKKNQIQMEIKEKVKGKIVLTLPSSENTLQRN